MEVYSEILKIRIFKLELKYKFKGARLFHTKNYNSADKSRRILNQD